MVIVVVAAATDFTALAPESSVVFAVAVNGTKEKNQKKKKKTILGRGRERKV